eukprot:365901-Chlamydomonas_euryale.AAC.3
MHLHKSLGLLTGMLVVPRLAIKLSSKVRSARGGIPGNGGMSRLRGGGRAWPDVRARRGGGGHSGAAGFHTQA